MLIYVQMLTYPFGNIYKFEKEIEKISDDITKEELNKMINNMTKWYKNYIKFDDPNTIYVAIYKDIIFDKDHLVWENGKYINKLLIEK